jgi:hypothetical protein
VLHTEIPRTGGLSGTTCMYTCRRRYLQATSENNFPAPFRESSTMYGHIFEVVNKTRPARFYLQFSGLLGLHGLRDRSDPDRAFLCMCNCVAATSVTAAELWLRVVGFR